MWDWEEAEPKIVSKLMHYLPVDENLRQARGIVRKNHLMKFKTRFFQVFNCHQYIEENFSILIRSGYLGRNPLHPHFRRNLHDHLDKLFDASVDELPPIIPAGNLGFTLLGSPGMGKTMTLAKILRLYPQVIEHRNHPTEPTFRHTQVVWLFLTCPHDSSTKGLCKDFFKNMDAILGTHYYNDYSRETEDGLVAAMATVAGLHSLGVLVIDEIQFLNPGKSGGRSELLKFLVQLQNSIGIPVVFVGTHAAASRVAGNPHQGRRSVGIGGATWEPLPSKSVEWELLLESMWEQQILRNFVPLDPDLAATMYLETQGIVSYAIDLFYFTQRDAIDNGTEVLTVDGLKRAAKDHMQFSRPYVNALRSDDVLAARLLEDVVSANYENFRDFAEDQLLLPPLKAHSRPLQLNGTNAQSSQVAQPSFSGVSRPGNLIPSCQPAPPATPIGGTTISPKPRTRGKKTPYPAGTLMAICADAKLKPDMNPYQALKQAGFVRAAAEFLPEMKAA